MTAHCMPGEPQDRLLAPGFSSFVFETRAGLIRRVARTAEAAESFERECRFLPRLAVRLPVPVPEPLRCERGTMFYRKLAGEPLGREQANGPRMRPLAHDVAGFMNALHAIRPDEAIEWGVPETNRTAELLGAADRVLAILPAPLRDAARAWREEWELEYKDGPKTLSLIHGDLWHENLLVDEGTGRLTGVVDFERTSVGDPAWDLAAQLHCGEEFARAVLERYRFAERGLWARACAFFRLRPFEGMDWAIRQRDAKEFADGLRKLQEVGVLPAGDGMTRMTTAAWLGTLAE